MYIYHDINRPFVTNESVVDLLKILITNKSCLKPIIYSVQCDYGVQNVEVFKKAHY